MVDVEKRALRALEEDALSGAPTLVEQRPDRVHERKDAVGDRCQFGEGSSPASISGFAEAAAQRVVMHKQPLDLLRQRTRSARSIRRMARRPTLSS